MGAETIEMGAETIEMRADPIEMTAGQAEMGPKSSGWETFRPVFATTGAGVKKVKIGK